MKCSCRFAFVAPIVFFATILFAQTNPIPLIYQPLFPASINPGHATFTLQINGTGFRSGAVVKFSDHVLQTTVLSEHALKATVPAAYVAQAKAAAITVTNPGTRTIASNVIYLPVRKPASTVTLSLDSANVEGGQIAAGDFNNDGRPDLSVTQDQGGNEDITMYLGKGGGAFLNAGSTVFGGVENTTNGVGDFNNDGKLDLIAGSSSGGLDNNATVYLGDGKGGLNAISGGLRGAVGDFADINGDGVLDAATVIYDGNNFFLLIFLGNGDGTFRERYQVPLNLSDASPALLGDFNGDGKLDVAIVGRGSQFPGPGPVAVLLGNGDGTFQHEVDYEAPILNGTPYGALADVNRDGKLDIVTGGVSILLGVGDGTFVAESVSKIFSGANVAVADLNGDGILDIACIAEDSYVQTLNLLLGNGDGTFQAPLTVPAGEGAGVAGISNMAIADFNDDGKLDIAISGGGPNFQLGSTVFVQNPAK